MPYIVLAIPMEKTSIKSNDPVSTLFKLIRDSAGNFNVPHEIVAKDSFNNDYIVLRMPCKSNALNALLNSASNGIARLNVLMDTFNVSFSAQSKPTKAQMETFLESIKISDDDSVWAGLESFNLSHGNTTHGNANVNNSDFRKMVRK